MNNQESSESFSEEDKGPDVKEFETYEEVQSHWLDLNRSYKSGELSLDWHAHKLIWDHFYRPRGAKLKIVAGFEDSQCLAIFPLIWNANDPIEPPGWYLGDDFIIAREYFCAPENIHRFLDVLPPHFSEDMSCFYTPPQNQLFYSTPGGVVDLKGSEEEYLQSLKKKSRHTLKRTAAVNADIFVEVDTRIRGHEIQGILKSQLEYWKKKNGVLSEAYRHYTRDKINTDILLMTRAQEMGKLIALYFHLNGELVAANFSVRREKDRVDDYMCIRNCGEEFAPRGLGIFAILKNMEICRSMGIRFYDLSACLKDYKKKFINFQSSYYSLGFPKILDRIESNSPGPETSIEILEEATPVQGRV